ncbi:MAG: UDP-N-acetylmuramoyl-tripeptide--D-alanyl-D-alanine ligase [Flavobacterium sp.]|nr:UDP-N-acetylmuramoyl-tripeptide--D-alanyl-D-alanine ligase [Candidatus Neoflavobacterium equi]
MNLESIHNKYISSSGVTTDTRNIMPNSMFFALTGEHFNGNLFAQQALDAGAAFCVVDQEVETNAPEKIIRVNDTLEALQQLANYHRNQFDIPVIGLTGSNGKTTTKELIHAVLSQKFNTIATIGNLNNHIGVPLTLLRINKDTEVAIVEMGANHQKEIELLCEIANPDYGYITNFGKAHLEGFGGVEGVIKGKSELYAYLLQNHKTAFINLNDPIQKEKSQNLKHLSFGADAAADVVIEQVEADPFVRVGFHNLIVQSQLIGIYNSNNMAAAITMGIHFGVADADIKKGLENYIPQNNRSQIINRGSNKIIKDAYNANPSSMEVALNNIKQLEDAHKIAVLGDMFELGTDSAAEHKNIIELALSSQLEGVYFVGTHFFEHAAAYEERAHFFNSIEDLKTGLQLDGLENKTILIKGSRGMALERLLE